MYFCKLAPHKSDMQPSREKAGKKGHIHTYVNTNTKGKSEGTEQENEVECIEKRQGGGSSRGHCSWAPVHNQPIPCQFHAQQPTGKAAV